MVGTFHRAAKPGAPPFAEVGAEVGEHSVSGIIETMKLMNSVAAGVAGEVAEIANPNRRNKSQPLRTRAVRWRENKLPAHLRPPYPPSAMISLRKATWRAKAARPSFVALTVVRGRRPTKAFVTST